MRSAIFYSIYYGIWGKFFYTMLVLYQKVSIFWKNMMGPYFKILRKSMMIFKFWINQKMSKMKNNAFNTNIFFASHTGTFDQNFFWPKLGSNQWPLDNFLPSTSHVVNTHEIGGFCTKYAQNRTVFSRLLWSRITSHNEIRAWQPHQLCPTFLFWSYLGDSAGFFVIWILRFIFAKMATIYMYKYLILQQKRCTLYISI